MKTFRKWLGYVVAAIAIIFSSGSAFALADDPALTDPVGDLDGGAGKGVAGANSRTQTEDIMEGGDGKPNLDWYVKQINKRIVEMKLESCPIDQILRAATRSNHSKSMKI